MIIILLSPARPTASNALPCAARGDEPPTCYRSTSTTLQGSCPTFACYYNANKFLPLPKKTQVHSWNRLMRTHYISPNDKVKIKKRYQSLELQVLVPCPLALLPLQSPCPSPADLKTMAATAAPSHAHPSPGRCQRELPVSQLAWESGFLFTQQWIVPETFVSPEVASSVG